MTSKTEFWTQSQTAWTWCIARPLEINSNKPLFHSALSKHTANPTFLSLEGPPRQGAPAGDKTHPNTKPIQKQRSTPNSQHTNSFQVHKTERFKSLKSFSKLKHNFVGFTNVWRNSRWHCLTLYDGIIEKNSISLSIPHNPLTNRLYLCCLIHSRSHVSVIPHIWLKALYDSSFHIKGLDIITSCLFLYTDSFPVELDQLCLTCRPAQFCSSHRINFQNVLQSWKLRFVSYSVWLKVWQIPGKLCGKLVCLFFAACYFLPD